MPSGSHSNLDSQKRLSFLLVALMVLLPWATFSSSNLDDNIESRGIHNIGYVYHAEFYNNYLFAASREGLQIFQID